MTQDVTFRAHKYLRSSTFWGIRQGFPKRLGLLISAVTLLLPILLWMLLSYSGWVSAFFLPTPTFVLKTGLVMLMEDNLWYDILVSCGRVLAAFIISAGIGIPVGIAMGTFHSMEHVFAPLIGMIRYMPITAFGPLIILWLGLGEVAKVAIITLAVVFYNAIMIADAVKFIPNDMINVAYTLGGSRRDVLMRVILPATFPSVLDTLRTNISTAWNFVVIAELLSAQHGLGITIIKAQRFLKTEKVLFCIAIIGLIGLLIDYSLKIISQRLTPWADQTRH